MKFLSFALLILIGLACSNEKKEIEEFNPEQVFGEEEWKKVMNEDYKVLYFLSPECPLCQNYAKAMRDLKNEFDGLGIKFIGIFPGKEYSNSDIKAYMLKYDLDFNAYLDPEMILTNKLGAEITPEAFLLNKDNEVLYSGAIDNWAISLGQKRRVITKKYLENSLTAVLESGIIDPKKTDAVGCFIQ